MAIGKAISQKDISFTESLDTMIQLPNPDKEVKRVERILKLSALFSEQLILSATQFVDNLGIRRLFLKDDCFKDFLGETVLVGMYPGISSFYELIEDQLGRYMKYSSFPSTLRNMIEDGKVQDPSHLFRLTYRMGFMDFINELDERYSDDEKRKDVKFRSYPELVEKNLERKSELQHRKARNLCEELLDRTEHELRLRNKDTADRTIYLQVIDKSERSYDKDTRDIVKRFFVNEPYNRNFWESNAFNCLTHPNENDTTLYRKAFGDAFERTENSKNLIRLPPFSLDEAIHLKDLDFGSLLSLRSTYGDIIKKHLQKIRNAKDHDHAWDRLQGYLNFIIPKIKEIYIEKRVKRKIKKIQIAALGCSLAQDIYGLYFGVPYLTPEISIVKSSFALFVTGLVEPHYIRRQTKRFKETEEYLRSTTINSKSHRED